ncbi:hypothetical protein Pmar_PMAR002406 [Perkinsus marinus ATCC 50983]|uniref:Uncharacterized protein n=1 Tax=Perkinsus marinus (strain ATCC 50983 / TXsc) TaxID=423536 RepID=C5LYV3_PERM5|nr:hypothetical protein Pmar_PMAR002406 [Perkinsus marinus ATCC 50983]EEQ98127.1 hypothetical protein Pmar_PMAR002406 [Perkinsus marinus ATCC 50983]|eukprot:XP_002765410.1 hypothetical protein Pmar_PMAR002406 [Perkinsus marinus ATCC 50983]
MDSINWDLGRHLSRLEEYIQQGAEQLSQDDWYEVFLFFSMWDTDAWCSPLGRDLQLARTHPALLDYGTAVRDLSSTIELRLHCMYVNYFCTSQEKDRVLEDLKLILEATRQLRESQKLSTILQVGRALKSDGGERGAAAQGLKLSVVFDLVNIEGENVSLIEYLVQQLRDRRPSLLQFEDELNKATADAIDVWYSEVSEEWGPDGIDDNEDATEEESSGMESSGLDA